MDRLRTEDGFSLLEAVVALAVLSLFILPVASLLNSGLSQMQKAKDVAEATALMQMAVEEVKLLADPVNWDKLTSEQKLYPEGDSLFFLDLEVTPERDNTVKRVTVSIRRNDDGSLGTQIVGTQLLLLRDGGV